MRQLRSTLWAKSAFAHKNPHPDSYRDSKLSLLRSVTTILDLLLLKLLRSQATTFQLKYIKALQL